MTSIYALGGITPDDSLGVLNELISDAVKRKTAADAVMKEAQLTYEELLSEDNFASVCSIEPDLSEFIDLLGNEDAAADRFSKWGISDFDMEGHLAVAVAALE